MKIVVLGMRGFPDVQGGIERHCEHLYPRLVERGCEVTVFCRKPYVRSEPFCFRGVEMLPVWTPKNKFLETFIHTGYCTLLARKYKPDIIHYHAIGPSIFIPLAKQLGMKVVATHHGFDYERIKWGSLAKSILKRGERNMGSADQVIIVSEHIRKRLQPMMACPIETIPNGVDLPEIRPLTDFGRRLGLNSGKYFLFAGRLVPEKGVHDLFEAFKNLKSDWKLIIAGDADHETNYSKKLKLLAGTIKNVVMAGFVTGMPLHELFSNAGCFVLPSSHEGLPIALLEALSFGIPSVVSDIEANRSISHESVLFYPVHNKDRLCACLNEQVLKKKNAERDGPRKYVAENFNWDHIADTTCEIMKRIVKC